MKKPLIFMFLLILLAMGACDKGNKHRENPLLTSWNGNFGLPEFSKLHTQDYIPAFKEALRLHDQEIENITSDEEAPSFENTILAYDNSGILLERIEAIYSLMGDANTDEELEGIKEDVAVMLAEHSDAIFHNADLFAKIKTVYDNRNSSGLSYMQKRLTEKIYEDFIDEGAGLSESDQKKIGEINKELAIQETQYGIRLFRATKDSYLVADSTQIKGLPFVVRDTVARIAREAKMTGQFIFTLDEPLYNRTMIYATDPQLREQLYNLYVNRCRARNDNDNTEGVIAISRLRSEKAKLLGYDSYDAYVTERRMAGSTQAVYSFLEGIWTPAQDKAKEELALMATRLPSGDSLGIRPCDLPYYENRVLKSDIHMDQELSEVYFPLDNVRQGAFELANLMFGVTFRPILPEVYSPDCDTFEVRDIDNTLLGLLLLDYYPRPGKKAGAWMQPLILDTETGENKAVCLQFNFMRSNSESIPTTLYLEEIETLFREIGNALTFLFVDVPYRSLAKTDPGLSGILGALMSHWAFDPQVLKRYAIHYASGKPIPESMLQNITDIGTFGRGCATVSDMASAYLDLDVHGEALSEDFNPAEYEQVKLREILKMDSSLAPVFGTTDFRDIFDGPDAAAYYEKLWSDVLAADLYEKFNVQGNVYDRRIAENFRKEILAKGVSYPPEELFHNFSGEEMSPEAFLVSNGFIEPPAPEETPEADMDIVNSEPVEATPDK